jgi:hypothetical protein
MHGWEAAQQGQLPFGDTRFHWGGVTSVTGFPASGANDNLAIGGNSCAQPSPANAAVINITATSFRIIPLLLNGFTCISGISGMGELLSLDWMDCHNR